MKTKHLAVVALTLLGLLGCATPDTKAPSSPVAEAAPAAESAAQARAADAPLSESSTAQLRRFSRFQFASPSDWRMGMVSDSAESGLVTSFSGNALALLSIAHNKAQHDVEQALQEYLVIAAQIYPRASSTPLTRFGRYDNGVGRTLVTQIQAGTDGAVRRMQVELYFVIVDGQIFRLERMLPVDAAPDLREQLQMVTDSLELR